MTSRDFESGHQQRVSSVLVVPLVRKCLDDWGLSLCYHNVYCYNQLPVLYALCGQLQVIAGCVVSCTLYLSLPVSPLSQ